MRDGKCPRCGNSDVYRCHVPRQGGGISAAGDNSHMLLVRDVYSWEITMEWETLLCAECGYYENYLLDRPLITRLTTKPENSIWKKVGS